MILSHLHVVIHNMNVILLNFTTNNDLPFVAKFEEEKYGSKHRIVILS